MKTNNEGKWYDDVLLQYNYPEIANVAVADYVAKTFKGNRIDELQHPFYIAETEVVTLKVEPWLGDVITFKFAPGLPMPIRRIIKDPANSKTSVQIGY